MNIDRFYKEVVIGKIAKQEPEMNKRTGVAVRALPGITFKTDLERDGFPLLSLRKMSFSFVSEIMWFVSGQKDTTWLSQHTKIWDAFKDETGEVSSAYGYRWREHFGVDQLDTVIAKLEKDKSTRHAVMMMWSPKDDLLLPQKNVPCPFALTLNIISDRLHLHLIIRSNDMILGFPTDVAGFAFLQHIIARKLDVPVGMLTVSISNAHIYENQMHVVEELAVRPLDEHIVSFITPELSYERAYMLDDSLIDEVRNRFVGYVPQEAIRNIPIAL